MLREVFAEFGKGVHESLTRTLGGYLEVKNGKKAWSNLTEAERKTQVLSHNSPAERPFAVIKHLVKSCPNMSLSNLSALAHARANGTFKDGGAFMTADPRLAKAIAKLHCTRKHSLGRITILLRRWKKIDEAAESTHRKEHTAAKHADSTAAAARRAVKVNVHSKIPLDHAVAKLRLQLKGHQQVSRGAGGRCLTHLKGQFDHRVTGGRLYPIASIPKKHRTKGKPHALKKAPRAEQGCTKGVEGEVKHLTELVELMIEEDAKHE
jgi:hypothetical protein